jgi:AraC-like DNA-binding protein
VWGRDTARRWDDAVAAAARPGAALEALVLGRWDDHRPDLLVAEVARRLDRGDEVAAVAGAVGLGARQLHRRSLAAFGYGPKVLARILRLGRALDLARAGVGLADAAHRSGYADQPHLARDVRALTGTSVTTLLRP